jgi:hypothetical protein
MLFLGLSVQSLSLLLIQICTIYYVRSMGLFWIYTFMFGYAISLGGPFYVYQTEILAPELIPFASLVQWLLTFVISSFDLSNIDNSMLFSISFLFFFISLFGTFIFQGFSVETKHKSFSKIINDWKKKTFMIY